MPGHVISLACSCGLSGLGTPGERHPGSGRKWMAYEPPKPSTQSGVAPDRAQGTIVTVLETEARARGLIMLEDPFLIERGPDGDRWGPLKGYRCPQCGEDTLSMEKTGYWG